ncbi:MAG TPA: dienelactone hydrolase family protein [Acidimicrobiia bacterium]|jgi:carboxymethylenebutenolidase
MAELARGAHDATVERTSITGADGVHVPMIHATPVAARAATGVVVHPDIMGIRPLFDDLCARLASYGYAVACPEPFARAAPEVRAAEEPTARMGAVRELDDGLQLDDLVRAADFLMSRDGVDRVQVIGFCMGGMQTLKAATSRVFARAVPFYGMIRLPADWRGGWVREPLDSARDVCPTLAIFGGADHFTPPDDIDALRAAWVDRPDCQIVVYPEAEHGFVHAPERPAHRADDAADAWRRTLDWLATP